MSYQNYTKSVTGIKGVFCKGKVNELRQRYEFRCMEQNVLPRSKSESSLNMKEITSDVNQSFKNLPENNNDSASSASININKKNKILEKMRSINNTDGIKIELEINSRNNIASKHEKDENPFLRNYQQNESEEGSIYENISTLPRVIKQSKRPIPAPRVLTSQQKQTFINSDNLQKNKNSQDVDTILNNTFVEAQKSGNIENLRKSLLSLMDQQIDEMKSHGFDDNQILNGINEYEFQESSDEDNNELNSDEEDLSEEEIEDGQVYVNMAELLCSKVKKNDKEANQSSDYKEHETEAPRFPVNGNIDNYIIRNQSNFSELNLKGSNKIDIFDWNIPPEPDRSLKPAAQNTKNIACSKNYDETEDEIYEPITTNNFVGVKPEIEINESSWKRRTENQPTIQSTKLSKIVQEFKQTEKRHLEELNHITPVFKLGIKMHPSPIVKTKAALICASTDKLLEIQNEFAHEIEETSSDSVETVLQILINFEKLFRTYKQCLGYLGTNKSLTITIGYTENDFKKEINFSSILNRRLTNYEMFLERIRKEVSHQDPNLFQMVLCSLNTVNEIIKSCNTMLLLSDVPNIPLKTDKYGSLNDVREAPSSLFVQCCPFDVSGYGEYLLKDKFKISKPFMMTLTIFLFDKIILFTTEQQNDQFYYHSHIKTNDVRPMPINKRKKEVLVLQHFSKSKQYHSPTNYKLRAKNANIAETWRNKINHHCLWSQEIQIKEEVTRRYTRKKHVSKFFVDEPE